VGFALVEADLSQAEARVVAALCNDKTLLNNWNDPEFDVHTWTAAQVFSKEPSEVTKTERFLGKVARHALNYGMGWKTFQGNVNSDADSTGVSITASEAKRIVAAYHGLHKSLQSWWKQVGSRLSARGCLLTTFGRRRTFFGRRSANPHLDEVHKEAIAFEPQSTVADLLNRGMLRWWERYDGKFGRLIAQVHDSVLLEVPTAKVRGVAHLLKRCLEEEITINGIKLTIPADVSYSTESWADMVEL
jgi:DNA polymerase-1